MQLSVPACRARGFMLLEVLVAMLLVALGLMALAASQAAALRATRSAMDRAQAGRLAADLAERLRAHRALALADDAAMAAYRSNLSWAAQQAGAAASSAGACDGAASACPARQFAQADADQWRQLVRQLLPGGAVYVDILPDPPAADVWVAWQEPRGGFADESPRAVGECPAGLGIDDASGVRCVHLKVAW